MNVAVGRKAIITVDNWFYAPDGQQYRAVFGTVKAVLGDQETLGIKTNSRSTNWYIEIGNMTIAGCQVYCAIHSDTCETGMVRSCSEDKGIVTWYEMPSRIYNADNG